MHIPEGTVVDGRFRIGKMLGAGGMGSVYEAQQLDLDRAVAIKFISEAGMLEPEAFTRFQQEAKVLSQLQHKNVVHVYAFGRWQDSAYMVMEEVKGVSLQHMLRPCLPLDFDFVLKMGIGICQGLAAAHASGVVHRDLKPSNLLINEFGEVKIIDFGLAKLMEPSVEKQKMTDTGATVGSVLYMSPEQCRGEPVSTRSDVYSLGCVLHHCLRGEPPFSGEHSVVVMLQHTEGEAPRLEDPRLQVVVDTAMAKNPDDRYQTMEAFARDLEAVARGAVVGAKIKATGSAASEKPKSRTTTYVAAIAALLAAIAVGAYFFTHQTRRETVTELKQTYEQLSKQIGRDPASFGDNNVLLAHAQVCAKLAQAEKDSNALYISRMDGDMRAVWTNTAEKFENQGKLPEAHDVLVRDLLPLAQFPDGKQTVLMKKRIVEQLMRCDIALNNHQQWKADTDAMHSVMWCYDTANFSDLKGLTDIANDFRKLNRDDIADELENKVIAKILEDPHIVDSGEYYAMQDVVQNAAEIAHSQGRGDDAEALYRLGKKKMMLNFGR